MTPAPGVLLVATPALTDPHFRRTLVYLVEHSADGTLGFIVNRSLSIPLGELWGECPMGLADCLAAAEGGPVEHHKGLLLHRHPGIVGAAPMGHGLFIGGDIAQIGERWSSGPDHTGPRLYLGHSGWSGGQLEREIAEGTWTLRPGSTELVVSGASAGLDGERLWQHLAGTGGGHHGLPEPSLN